MTAIDLTAPAHVLRDALRARSLAAANLVEASLARIAALNPELNAVVTLDAEGARAAAREADRRLAAGVARPLEGLPITIKDAFDVAGMVSTAGLPAYAARVPDEDAAAVARLRAAGAIILGKTNVPVFSGDFQSYNPIHGVTRNPWNASRSPGGSSGGAAVAVATGMAAFELGTDLGGSIRWPASATGVFGLKTSWGLVSTAGAIPPPPEKAPPRNVELMVAGPIARTAEDLAMVLEVIAGPRNPTLPHAPFTPPRRTSPKGLRVAVWCNDSFAQADAEVIAGVRRAAGWLASRGAYVNEAARPSFRFEEAFETYALLNHAVVAYGLPPKVRAKIQAAAGQFAAGDLSHRALQARGARMTPGLHQDVKGRLMALARQWARFFGQWDVVLCPPAPVLAIPHDHAPDIHARTLSVNGEPIPYLDFLVWSSLATGPGLPAVSVPVDRAPEGSANAGCPRGVQVIAAQGEDFTAIEVARMIEAIAAKMGGGYAAPPGAG